MNVKLIFKMNFNKKIFDKTEIMHHLGGTHLDKCSCSV